MRLALYARVSTRYQRPGPQLDVLREYAKRRGGEALEFVDKGVSGAGQGLPVPAPARPHGRRVLASSAAKRRGSGSRE
jgi:DNA invertase Pin-like site-specific DNA recombinase